MKDKTLHNRDFTRSMWRQILEQIDPSLAYDIISQIWDANREIMGSLKNRLLVDETSIRF